VPSPFPGMDPYLEGSTWLNFHGQYFVFLSRLETRPVSEVWPIGLDQSLPLVPVPFLPGDPDTSLELQLAFSNVYDVCYYSRLS
jgi:Protein of unknown function (DUF4058)